MPRLSAAPSPHDVGSIGRCRHEACQSSQICPQCWFNSFIRTDVVPGILPPSWPENNLSAKLDDRYRGRGQGTAFGRQAIYANGNCRTLSRLWGSRQADTRGLHRTAKAEARATPSVANRTLLPPDLWTCVEAPKAQDTSRWYFYGWKARRWRPQR